MFRLVLQVFVPGVFFGWSHRKDRKSSKLSSQGSSPWSSWAFGSEPLRWKIQGYLPSFHWKTWRYQDTGMGIGWQGVVPRSHCKRWNLSSWWLDAQWIATSEGSCGYALIHTVSTLYHVSYSHDFRNSASLRKEMHKDGPHCLQVC